MTQHYTGRTAYTRSGRPAGRRSYAPRYRFNRAGLVPFFAALIVVIAAVIGVCIWRNRTIATLSNDRFYQGVHVNGFDLSGLTYDQAKDKLSAELKQNFSDAVINLTYDPAEYGQSGQVQSWSYDYASLLFEGNEEDLNALVDEIVTPKLEQAYAQGRTGTARERLNAIKRLSAEGWSIESSASYDVLTSLKPKVEAIKAKLEVPAANASYRLTDTGAFAFTEAKNGWSLDSEALLEEIQTRFQSDHSVNVPIRLQSVPAAYTVTQLKNATDLIASFTTDYSTSVANRKQNIQTAMKAFNGKIILPGEVVSFNATTGERTQENGYLPAPMIGTNKAVIDDFGGGVCQASTTIYLAALKAQLQITERYHHSYPSSYADKGLDATVNWPYADLKFKNNRDLPIYIQTYCTSNKVCVSIYGKKQENDGHIYIVSDVVESGEVPEVETVKDTKGEYVQYKDEEKVVVNSHAAYKVDVYEVLKDETGKEIRRSKLYTDNYAKIVGKKYVGVKDRPPKEKTTSAPSSAPSAGATATSAVTKPSATATAVPSPEDA